MRKLLIFFDKLCIIYATVIKEESFTMKSVQISLQMASQVKTFVSIVQKYSYEIDLRSDRYVVDAKSILGIFSLDLSKPLTVEIHAANCDDLLAELKQFEK